MERGVEINNACDFCGEEMEDIVHIVWTCSFAQEFWSSCPVSLPFNAGNFISSKDWVQQVVDDLQEDNKDHALIYAWRL